MVKNKSLLAPSLKIKHSQLYVKDLEKVAQFYTNVVRLDVLERTPSHIVLGHDQSPVIELVSKPEFPNTQLPSAGLFHNAIVYSSRADLAQTLYNILKNAPDSFEGSADHLVSEAFYFHDPELNGLELYFDRPRETWKWEDDMIKMDSLYIDPLKYIQQYISDISEVSKTLGHIHLRVGDIPTAQTFYVNQLGFDVTAHLRNALFISVGGYHHHVGMNTWFSNGVGYRVPSLGLAEVRFELPKESAHKLVDRLVSNNLQFNDKKGEITIHDPWGNKLVFGSK